MKACLLAALHALRVKQTAQHLRHLRLLAAAVPLSEHVQQRVHHLALGPLIQHVLPQQRRLVPGERKGGGARTVRFYEGRARSERALESGRATEGLRHCRELGRCGGATARMRRRCTVDSSTSMLARRMQGEGCMRQLLRGTKKPCSTNLR